MGGEDYVYRIMSDHDLTVQVGPNYADEDRVDDICEKLNLTAAITAFLRTVDASPAMIEAGGVDIAGNADLAPRGLGSAFKAMSATLADEVEKGDD